MSKYDTPNYPRNLSNYDKNTGRMLKAQILRRLRALKVEYITNVKYGMGGVVQNMCDFVSLVPGIIKNPIDQLKFQRISKIANQEQNFVDTDAPILLTCILEKLQPNQIMYIKSRDEFEYHTGKPSFVILVNEHGNFILLESYNSYEGNNFKINKTLTKEEIIEEVRGYLDPVYIKDQIVIWDRTVDDQSQLQSTDNLGITLPTNIASH
jgi:hypothetical protein